MQIIAKFNAKIIFFFGKLYANLRIGKIEERLDVVETFVNDVHLRQTVTEDHLRRMPDFQRLSKKLQKAKANLQDCYKYAANNLQLMCITTVNSKCLSRIYLGLSRLPMLVDCLLQHDGPHSAVLLPVLIQPLRNAEAKLSKLKDMIETTIDLRKAETGEYIVKSDFDEKLGGKFQSSST